MSTMGIKTYWGGKVFVTSMRILLRISFFFLCISSSRSTKQLKENYHLCIHTTRQGWNSIRHPQEFFIKTTELSVDEVTM